MHSSLMAKHYDDEQRRFLQCALAFVEEQGENAPPKLLLAYWRYRSACALLSAEADPDRAGYTGIIGCPNPVEEP